MKTRIALFFILFCSAFVNGQTEIKNSYSLPKIDELKYIAIPTALERIFPHNSCQENLKTFLKSYHKRLADINGMEVYLVKQSCNFSQNTCICFETTAQGEFSFLVVFNKKLKQAEVLICSFSFLSDSEVYDMQFKIKRNKIKLTESGFTEGENSTEEFSKNIHELSILKNGEIRVDSKN